MTDHTSPMPTVTSFDPAPQVRRPLNTTALVVGLILVGLSALWWGHELDLVPDGASVFVLPLLLIGAGVIGLVGFVLRGRGTAEGPDSSTTQYTHPTDLQEDHHA